MSTYETLIRLISSRELVHGLTLCGSSGSLMTFRSGVARVRASRSALRETNSGPMTPATCGPFGPGSSASALLQSSLVSRLRALTDSAGSPLYDLTWKQKAMPLGGSISALRAWGRRTSGLVCGLEPCGWPTPTASPESRRHGYMRAGNEGTTLLDAARSISGSVLSGSLVAIESAQLNPELSRWLMGLPREWLHCAPLETR